MSRNLQTAPGGKGAADRATVLCGSSLAKRRAICYTLHQRKAKGSVAMQPYTKKVQYYETDMMGIAHHANYIRWMEEARIDFLDRMGFPYARMEAEGIISPVRAVSCQYKRPCTFGDTIAIAVAVDSFNGVVLTLPYDVRKAGAGEAACTASSQHVFLDREGRFVRMKRVMPDFCEAVQSRIAKAEEACKSEA